MPSPVEATFAMNTALLYQRSCLGYSHLPCLHRRSFISPHRYAWSPPQCRQVGRGCGAGPLCCSVEPQEVIEIPRADDVLPDNLPDAIRMSSEATASALSAGAMRCTVEIHLPEFWDPTSGPVFKEEGDQQRFWKLTRKFVDNLIYASGFSNVRVVYPDMGVAAMLGDQWKDKQFAIGSLSDRVLVEKADELVVVASPDPPGLEACQKLVYSLEENQAVVLFNPRLSSGDVGVGYKIRQLRKTFLSTFLITYSLYPIGDIGSIFRRYPGIWQVFLEDPAAPGRFRLVDEREERPGADILDYIITEATQGDRAEGDDSSNTDARGVIDQIVSTAASFQRFLKSVTK